MVAGREIFSSTHVLPKKRMGLSFAAPLAGRDGVTHRIALADDVISIHAPLAGRDRRKRRADGRERISIHAPVI